MFCAKCGAENREDSKFCVSCGESLNRTEEIDETVEVVKAEPVIEVQAEPKKNIASMVMGIVATALGGFSLCMFYAGFPFAIAAMIVGSIGKSKGATPHKLTTVGFWLGLGGLISSILWLIGYIVFVVALTASYA